MVTLLSSGEFTLIVCLVSDVTQMIVTIMRRKIKGLDLAEEPVMFPSQMFSSCAKSKNNK